MDDSDAARDAVTVAASLAASLDWRLVLLHAAAAPVALGLATSWAAAPGERDRQARAEEGSRLLEEIAHELGLPASVERRVELGDPALILLGAAEDEAAALLVVGTRGRGRLAAAVLGSVSSTAASRAPCPLVVVPRGGRLGAGPLVCGVDDSPAARDAARVARGLSDRLGSDLVLAHAVASPPVPGTSAVVGGRAELDEAESQRAEELLARLVFEQGLGTGVVPRVAFGSEAEVIAQLAEEEDAALVVIGTRRRGALRAAVSQELAAASPRPILVVPAVGGIPLRT